MKVNNLLLGLVITMAPGLSHAFMSTEDALSQVESDGLMKPLATMYLNGMAEALWWQSMAAKEYGKGIICIPDSQSLQTKELRLLALLSLNRAKNDLVGDEAALKQFLKDPVSMNLMFAWAKEYPCS